jgi:predicted small lipoprotein YifL
MRCGLIAGLLLMLTACGQYGELYLSESQEKALNQKKESKPPVLEKRSNLGG